MILEVVDLKKSFGGNQALKGVSFSLGEGEILGVVGPNGSGKTTLINLISGVLKPSSGNIIFRGKDITNLSPNKRAKLGIGRTFQITRLFGNLTVLENVLIPLHYGVKEKKPDEKALDLIEMVGLKELKDKKASNLSLAQRKRLELARSLALKPKLLLLDEVFAGLNPSAVAEVSDLLKKLHKEFGFAMILVEHVLKALFRLTEKVIVLASGEVIFEGHPKDMAKDEKVIKAYLGERFAHGFVRG